MLEQWIEAQASRGPRVIALATGHRSYTYSELAADIRRCAGWLKTLNLKPRSRAALQLPDVYAYWVLFFALEARQVITVGLYSNHLLSPNNISYLGIDYVFSDQARPEGLNIGWTRADKGWYRQFRRFRNVPLPTVPRRADDPICIVLSSATTGTAKKVLLERGMLELRTEFEHKSGIYAQRPGRTLAAMSPASIAALQLGLGSFAEGATLCIRANDAPWANTLLKLSVNILVLAPIHIEEMLKNLPVDFTSTSEISIFVVGGTLSEEIIQDLKRRISSNIIQGYGTTETSGITQGHLSLMSGAEDTAGFVNSWMAVSLIDEAGEECPPGVPGEVRVKGPTTIGGYLDDEEQSRKSFRSGWYHPGDLAIADTDGILRVMGRVDDIINLGGLKIVPATSETIFRSADSGLVDVAVFGAHDPDGKLSIWVAFVGPDMLNPRLISQALRGVPDVRTVRLSAIPRNFLGKVERAKLRGQAESGAFTKPENISLTCLGTA